MITPDFPINEKLRQQALEKYNLLDTLPEESYDNITSLMSYICDTPISLITLLDRNRNFLKSHHGVPFNESPREISFCGHAINSENPITIIEDARKDERFHDNPLVSEHNAIFYAGVPLVDPDGFKLGTLCVYDVKPRELTQEQINALLNMAKQVMSLFEEKYQNIKLQQLQESLEERNKNLEKFAGVVSHDLKSPLAQITALTELIEDDLKEEGNTEVHQYLEYIKNSSDTLRDYIDGILKFYKTDSILKQDNESVNFSDFMTSINTIFSIDKGITINYSTTLNIIKVNKAALTQVISNLVSNAIKYNDKSNTEINISLIESEDFYEFSVSDNGPGIEKKYLATIFDLFTTANTIDKNGESGTGIGLATVKKMITSLGGTISVVCNETETNGCNFKFSFAKNQN